jgi:hypothetical protein
VAENPVSRNQPIKHSIVPEYLLTLRFHWFIPAHQDFRYTGRDVSRFTMYGTETTFKFLTSYLFYNVMLPQRLG